MTVGRMTLDGKTVTDELTPFQLAVVKAGEMGTHSRFVAVARALGMIAYAICDLADAHRESRTRGPA